MTQRTDQVSLRHMLEYSRKAVALIEGRVREDLASGEVLCLALTRIVEVVGEAAPKVMMGKPVVRGTPIAVELIRRKISEGATEQELVDAYPRLTIDDIRAAIRYAGEKNQSHIQMEG